MSFFALYRITYYVGSVYSDFLVQNTNMKMFCICKAY